jgi:GNAT superfamily N-acetyltransferase
MAIETRELNPQAWPDLERLLTPSKGCDGCWCLNHHLAPGTPDVTGEPARLAFRALVESGAVHGVLAYEDEEPAGWCAVDRRVDLPGHDCTLPFAPENRDHTWSVHCFYVRPSSRGKGVSRRLLEHAKGLIRAHGGRVVEAYPTPPNAGSSTSAVPTGSLSTRASSAERRSVPSIVE